MKELREIRHWIAVFGSRRGRVHLDGKVLLENETHRTPFYDGGRISLFLAPISQIKINWNITLKKLFLEMMVGDPLSIFFNIIEKCFSPDTKSPSRKTYVFH